MPDTPDDKDRRRIVDRADRMLRQSRTLREMSRALRKEGVDLKRESDDLRRSARPHAVRRNGGGKNKKP